MSPRLTACLVLAGVFLLGAVTGGGVARFTEARHVHAILDAPPLIVRQKALLMALDRSVRLDDRQHEEVRAILAAHEPEVRELRRSIEPRIEALRVKTFTEIRGVLRPDQLERFQRFVERQETRSRRFDGGEDDGPKKLKPAP